MKLLFATVDLISVKSNAAVSDMFVTNNGVTFFELTFP